MVAALSTLLIFQLVGEGVVRALELPLPGAVVGLVLLYAALLVGRGPSEQLTTTGNVLLRHLPLFLVPVTTGLILHVHRLNAEWAPIIVTTVAGAAVTMATAAVSLRAFRRRQSLVR